MTKDFEDQQDLGVTTVGTTGEKEIGIARERRKNTWI